MNRIIGLECPICKGMMSVLWPTPLGSWNCNPYFVRIIHVEKGRTKKCDRLEVDYAALVEAEDYALKKKDVPPQVIVRIIPGAKLWPGKPPSGKLRSPQK